MVPQATETQPADLSGYTEAFIQSWAYEDLHEVRNVRPSFGTKLGLWGGVAYSGIETLLLRGKGWWTFRHTSEADRVKYLVRCPLSGIKRLHDSSSYPRVHRLHWIQPIRNPLRGTNQLIIQRMNRHCRQTS